MKLPISSFDQLSLYKMSFTERVSLATFLAQNKDVFWIVIHIGWGAFYGTSTAILVFAAIASDRFLRRKPGIRLRLFVAQTLWSLCQLAGVFAVPWLIGVIDKQVLVQGDYLIYLICSWLVSGGFCWWLYRQSYGESKTK
jgi:hypothetical protein